MSLKTRFTFAFIRELIFYLCVAKISPNQKHLLALQAHATGMYESINIFKQSS